MKIKKLAAICKKKKRAVIYERYLEGGLVQQYISDECAMYPIFGLPRLSKESLLTIFDVKEAEWDKWHVSVYEDPAEVMTSDTFTPEQPLERFYQPIVHNGKVLKSVMLDGETVFFDDAYIGPVSDAKEIMYYGRRSRFGMPVIAVKSGMMLLATIAPFAIADDDWIEMMEEMLAGCTGGKRGVSGVD